MGTWSSTAKKRKVLLAFMGLILACSVIVVIIGLIDTSLGEIGLLPIDTATPTCTASVIPTNTPTPTSLSTQTAILTDAPTPIRPTSTPLPANTAVATDIPTSTPVPTQPPPSTRAEVQLYASEVGDQLQTLTDALQATRALMQNPELTSEAWKTDVEAQLDIIRLAHQELTEMNVPVEMIGIHSAILNATLYCELATDYATSGIDNLNSSDIQIATNLVARCGANMSIALEVINEYQDQSPSPPPTQPAPATPTPGPTAIPTQPGPPPLWTRRLSASVYQPPSPELEHARRSAPCNAVWLSLCKLRASAQDLFKAESRCSMLDMTEWRRKDDSTNPR